MNMVEYARTSLLKSERLAKALRVERKRRPTAPTAASKERRLDEKRRRGDLKRLRRPPR